MYACMYVCMYVCMQYINIYVNTHTHIYTCIHTYIYIFVPCKNVFSFSDHTYTFTYICIYNTNIHTYHFSLQSFSFSDLSVMPCSNLQPICSFLYTNVYICMYVCMYVCMYRMHYAMQQLAAYTQFPAHKCVCMYVLFVYMYVKNNVLCHALACSLYALSYVCAHTHTRTHIYICSIM